MSSLHFHILVYLIPLTFWKKEYYFALAGNRTRIPCLEGMDANLYTTNALSQRAEVNLYFCKSLGMGYGHPSFHHGWMKSTFLLSLVSCLFRLCVASERNHGQQAMEKNAQFVPPIQLQGPHREDAGSRVPEQFAYLDASYNPACPYGGDCPFCLAYGAVSWVGGSFSHLFKVLRGVLFPSRFPFSQLILDSTIAPCHADQLSIDIISSSGQVYKTVAFSMDDANFIAHETDYPEYSPTAQGTLVCTNAFEWRRMKLSSESGSLQLPNVHGSSIKPGATLKLYVP